MLLGSISYSATLFCTDNIKKGLDSNFICILNFKRKKCKLHLYNYFLFLFSNFLFIVLFCYNFWIGKVLHTLIVTLYNWITIKIEYSVYMNIHRIGISGFMCSFWVTRRRRRSRKRLKQTGNLFRKNLQEKGVY